MASWHEHVMWWHVYPLGFCGAPIRVEDETDPAEIHHRLPRLLGWLDHVQELGLNGLLLGPVFASRSHGYDTLDYDAVDPRLGDDADLDTLVTAAHERGLRVLLDGVFNHVSWHHPLFQQVIAEGREGPRSAMFRVDWDAEGGPRHEVFEGHGDLVALNHDDPLVADLVADVMLHWLRRGVDGWRLDAAYAVSPDFWQRVLPRVRAEFPEALVVGEVLHGDYADIVRRSGMDTVTQYELWKAVWGSLQDRNFYELDHALGRHNGWLESFVPQTFVGNHDVTRIATRVGHEAAVLPAVVLMTVGGMPSVYYGDEFAYAGTKFERMGGDDDVRPVMPESPDEITLGRDVYGAYHDLVGIRRRHPWLLRARTEVVELANERVVYDAVGGGGERLRVELDVSGAPSARVSYPEGEVLFARP